MARGSQKNRNYRIEWSPNFAYSIGLITTDGSLSKDGRHFDFTSKDIQLVKTFIECLNLKDIKIGIKKSSTTKRKFFHVQFSNTKLYNWLLGIGLFPNKSRTLKEIKIPNKYFFDFLRGHFDGDGSCYSYWDKRWKNSFMFYIKFTSASKEHILWLRSKINKLSGIKGSLDELKKDNRKPIYQLKYAKRESIILFSKMYYKDDLPCLTRKHNKIEKILETEKKIKGFKGRVMELVDIYA